MKKNVLLAILFIFVFATVLAGCGGKTDGKKDDTKTEQGSETDTTNDEPKKEEEPKAEEPTNEPFTVSLRHIQVGEPQKNRLKILQDVIAKTEAEIPGLKFELDPVEDNTNRFTKLPAEMAAGNPPKIFDVFGGIGDAIKYAKAGRLLDLTPILDELGIAQDKFVTLDQFSYEGKIYGLPIGGNTEGFWYNKKIFADNGLTVPTSLEELEKVAETLKAKNITPFAAGSKDAWVAAMLPNTLIGRYAGPDAINGLKQGTHKWTDPEFVALFTKLDEWLKKGYFSKGQLAVDYATLLTNFITGKGAMVFEGSWRSSVFHDKEQVGADKVGMDMVDQFGFFPMPAVPSGKGDQTYLNLNYSNGYAFSSDVNENELKAIKAFIKNLYNDEMQLRGLLEDGILPSMKLSDDALTKVENPATKEVLDVLKKSAGGFPHYDSVVGSDPYKQSEIYIQKLIDGKTTPQEMAEALQKAQDAENSKAK